MHDEFDPTTTAVMTESDSEGDDHRPDATPSMPARAGITAAAGMASLGAGAIHAAAIGVHAEHRPAALAFTVLATLQICWGVLAIVRSGRLVSFLGVAIGGASLVGWAVAKTAGIAFIDGLDVAEPAQTADALCAGLALVSVVLAVMSLLPVHLDVGARGLGTPVALGAVMLIAFSFAGMAAAGTHVHDHGGAAHDHGDTAGSETAAGHSHGPAAAVAPVPYDPERTIDLGGVPGVTKEQELAAESIVRVTLAELPQWEDPATAEAAGFHSIGDGNTGVEHFINSDYMEDDVLLDPNKPESLVYSTEGGGRRLVAAMYMERRGMPLEDVPDIGGDLMQWHVHDNLCYNTAGLVLGVTNGDGECPDGLVKPEPTPMIHVWIEPHPCGPFAALEGIGGGTIAEGEEVLCDTAHGAPA